MCVAASQSQHAETAESATCESQHNGVKGKTPCRQQGTQEEGEVDQEESWGGGGGQEGRGKEGRQMTLSSQSASTSMRWLENYNFGAPLLLTLI